MAQPRKRQPTQPLLLVSCAFAFFAAAFWVVKLSRDKDEHLAARGRQLAQQAEELAKRGELLRQKESKLAAREEELSKQTMQLALREQEQRQAAAATPEKSEWEWQRDYKLLLADAQADLRQDAQLLAHYLRTSGVEQAWASRLAQQRQRGIIISAGSEGTLANAFVTLHVIRRLHKCSLPAAIMFWGASHNERIPEKTRELFQKQLGDVEFVDMSALPYPEYQPPLSVGDTRERGYFKWTVGFKIKVYALYCAPFREVLFLDSDNYPLLNPSSLFNADAYKKHGNLFWADYWSKIREHWEPGILYHALQLKSPWDVLDPSAVRQEESGQFLLDRAKFWQVLENVLFLNAKDMVTYRAVWGDKNTFRVAFYLAGMEDAFQQAPHWPGFTLGEERKLTGILQFHPNGTALFHHHNSAKFDPRSGKRRTTHLSAPVAEDLAFACVFPSFACPPEQVEFVDPAACNASLWDWPAAQESCAPKYDVRLPRGQPQKLPLYPVEEGSLFARVEAAAEAAHAEFVALQRH